MIATDAQCARHKRSGSNAYEHFICPICLELLCAPRLCHPCRHIFCDFCLRRLTAVVNSRLEVLCPMCRMNIHCTEPDKQLISFIQKNFKEVYNRRMRIVEYAVSSMSSAECSRHRLPGVAGFIYIHRLISALQIRFSSYRVDLSRTGDGGIGDRSSTWRVRDFRRVNYQFWQFIAPNNAIHSLMLTLTAVLFLVFCVIPGINIAARIVSSIEFFLQNFQKIRIGEYSDSNSSSGNRSSLLRGYNESVKRAFLDWLVAIGILGFVTPLRIFVFVSFLVVCGCCIAEISL